MLINYSMPHFPHMPNGDSKYYPTSRTVRRTEGMSVHRVLIKLSGLWVMEFWGFLVLFVFVRQDLTWPSLVALLCS